MKTCYIVESWHTVTPAKKIINKVMFIKVFWWTSNIAGYLQEGLYCHWLYIAVTTLLQATNNIQSNLSIATAQGKYKKWSLLTGSFSTRYNEKQFSRETKNVLVVDRWSLKQVWLYMWRGQQQKYPALIALSKKVNRLKI